MNDLEMRRYLHEGAARMGLALCEAQADLLLKYKGELQAWNRRTNLTSLEEDADILEKHFLDSLAGYCGPWIHPGAAVLDVGSGAGFPGVVLRVYQEGKDGGGQPRITLLETAGKKVRFLEHIVRALALDGIRVVHGRAELLAHSDEYREAFDVVTARAVAEMRVLVELCLPFLRVGGRLLAFKGPRAAGETAAAERAMETLGGKPAELFRYTLPFSGEARVLAVVEKLAPTPPRYPRRAGLPTKRPL